MTETVSSAAMAGMVVTLILSVGVPVAAALIVWKKFRAKWSALVTGAVTFVVFALILERFLHLIVLSALGESLTGNVWLYALYGGLAAGVFEETGRLVSMKFLMKKTLTRENALMYGVGHGGIESILLVGLTYVSNLVMSTVINSGMLEMTLSGLDESLKAQTIDQLSALWTTPVHLFYLAGIERIAAFTLHICLSYIVYRAVRDRKLIYYLLAIVIHLIIDAGLVLLTSVLPYAAFLGILVVAVAVLAVMIVRWYRREKAGILSL